MICLEFSSATETRPCEVKAFHHLQYLKISHCKLLLCAPTHHTSCLKQLEISRMDRYLPLANICGMNLTSLTNLCVKDIDGLECLPDWLFYNNQDLSELKILNCPKRC